jgi:uncharacterized protein (DUF58 family)
VSRAAATGLLGAALGSCGLLFALPSLLVPGLALALLTPCTVAWVALSARRATVRLSVMPRTVQEGDPVSVVVAVSKPRWAAPGELAEAALAREAETRWGSLELSVETRPTRRGWRSVDPVALTVRDPLGLAERRVDEASAEVLVLPRVEPVRPARRGVLEGTDGRARRGAGPELEFDLLRPHRIGSPASRIHWPTVARVDELVERRLRPEADSRPLVVLDSYSPESEEALDRAVRAAASLCRALASGGGCRLLLPGERRTTPVDPDLRAWPAAHARLALVDAGPSPRLPRASGASGVFWVVAARRPAPRALVRAASGHRYLVTPDQEGAGAAAFVVAGCAGYRLDRSAVRAA